jgi:hypothetical protein
MPLIATELITRSACEEKQSSHLHVQFFFFIYFFFFINVHFGNKINILVNLQEEQLSIFRNKPEGALVTLEDLNNMSYGSKVGKSN